jgi:cytochrome c oxidase subunit 3
MEGAHGFTLWPDFTAAPGRPAAPRRQFTPMGAWGIPALNTALLLSSGATVTWAHWGLLKGNKRQLNLGWPATVLARQRVPRLPGLRIHHAYNELGLTMGAGAYGATFFMLTGFHGFHVTLGTIMLAVILGAA